jgi:hypothetical protein
VTTNKAMKKVAASSKGAKRVKGTNARSGPWWSGRQTIPSEYLEAYDSALLRMAALLNCRNPDLGIKPSWLRLADRQLAQKLEDALVNGRPLKRGLVAHLVQHRSQKAQDPDFDDAENIFYGDFSFPTPAGYGPLTRVEHRSTPAFRFWSYNGLYWPTPCVPRSGESESEFMQAAAANYLLKNFFHNYVHAATQGITGANYHQFSGDARFDSDFAADNIGTLLLARAYGHDVLTRGQSSAQRSQAIAELLARNRCNRVFADRDQHRLVPAKRMPLADRWAEAEWMFRRRVAIATGNRLLELGASTTDVAVYPTGALKKSRSGWFYRKGNVVVRLNGVYIQTKFAPYVVDPNRTPTPRASARPSDIATDAAASYIRLLQQDSRLRDSAAAAMAALGARIAVPLVI